MSRMYRLTSLGTSMIFSINSSRKTFPVWAGRLVIGNNNELKNDDMYEFDDIIKNGLKGELYYF
jgi:hypothetical protein